MGFKQVKAASAATANSNTSAAAAQEDTTVKVNKVTATEAAAASVPTTPKTVSAEVVREATTPLRVTEHTTVVVPDTKKTAVALFGNNAGMGKSVLAVLTAAEPSYELLFPVLALQGGSSGGSFTPIKAVPEEVANQMPQGKKPFEGYIVGFRSEVVAWLVGFDQKEDDTKPSWSVVASSEDAATTELLRKACKAYQFTAGANKHKFDMASNDVGHVRPTLQLLVWLPDVEDLIVVQTPSHYISWLKSSEQLARNADPATGQLKPFPALIRPVSTPKTVNGNSILEHVIDISAMLNDAGGKLHAHFSKWREQAQNDAELVQKVGDWLNGTDAPVDAGIEARLRAAAAMG